ncbi:YdeI/OmpD-associated family protein [Paenibacillus sp.]|uniref:YdeI/OmpD-associated family protein n=1 Tax=Paenibacillus sp. TaxID=58172 RepID=UPI002811CB3B|nr:YdeI/OmpD-associated family protein [Paenibacillus sp.]
MKFRTTILLERKTATGLEVPPEIVDALGAGKKPPVRVTIGGAYTYRSTIASMGGKYMIPLSAEHRNGAGVAAGDEVDVELALDDEPRELAVPADVLGALDAVPEAKAFFDGLSYSNRRRIVLSIEGAKTQETRDRRLEKAIEALREGRMI